MEIAGCDKDCEDCRTLWAQLQAAERYRDELLSLARQVENDLVGIENAILSQDGTKRTFAAWSTPAHTLQWVKRLQKELSPSTPQA